jgi:hypothetical protein
MSNHTAEIEAPERDRKRRRGTIIKFSLAAVALFGIGAAATSAAWTDDAWFSASATAASVELQGSLSSTTGFVPADDVATAVVIGASTFANLTPGQVRTVHVYIKNTSSIPLTVVPTIASVVPATGNNVFGGLKPATYTATLSSGTVAPIAVDAVADYLVTVTAPAWDNTTDATYYQGATGTLTVKFTGTAS